MKLQAKNISCTFGKNTPLEIEVLHDVSTDFKQGEMVAIIGHSGSGKTTFIEHLNCLLKPQKGEITFEDLNCRVPLSIFGRRTQGGAELVPSLEKLTFKEIFDRLNSGRDLKESVWIVEDLLTLDDSQLIKDFLKILQQRKFLEKERVAELCFLLNFKYITSPSQGLVLLEHDFSLVSIFFLALLNSKLIFLTNPNYYSHVRTLSRINSFYEKKLMLVINSNLPQTKLLQKVTKILNNSKFIYEKKTLTVNKNKSNNKLLKFVRRTIGVVYQFAEYQLFKTSVAEDIMFGPLRMGVSRVRAQYLASKYIKIVGLDESFLNKSPFNLSGGQKRRVAIAGVLAMEPDFLIFDEPTAGLDPEGIESILRIFKQLNKQGQTVIICTHDLDNVLKWTDRVVFLKNGKIIKDGDTFEVLKNTELLVSNNLQDTKLLSLAKHIEKECGIFIGRVKNIKELARKINEHIVVKHD